MRGLRRLLGSRPFALVAILVIAIVSVVVSRDFAIALGVLAIAFGAYQFEDAGKQTDALKGLTDRQASLGDQLERATTDLGGSVSRLEGQVSTRSIGQFPRYLARINEVLGEAEQRIRIVCDHPGYGIYSEPDEFKRYAELIDDKKRAIDVEILYLDRPLASQLQREQAGRGRWADFQNSDQMLRFVGDADRAKAITQEDFLGLLAEADDRLLKRELHGVTTATPFLMPLYFWIADNERAVFALAKYDEQALELGFQTSDDTLLVAMHGIFDRYKLLTERVAAGDLDLGVGGGPAPGGAGSEQP